MPIFALQKPPHPKGEAVRTYFLFANKRMVATQCGMGWKYGF